MTQLQVRIVEDFPERVSKARTGLYQLMKDSIEQGKTAFFKSDKLVVDGDYFMFDFEQKKPIQVSKQDAGQRPTCKHKTIDFNLCSLNIQGLKKHASNTVFKTFCEQFNIIALYETWQTKHGDFENFLRDL